MVQFNFSKLKELIKKPEVKKVSEDIDEDEDVEEEVVMKDFQELDVIEKIVQSGIFVKFFKVLKFSDNKIITQHIRDVGGILILDTSVLQRNSITEVRELLNKLKQTSDIYEYNVYALDNQFVLFLPLGASLIKENSIIYFYNSISPLTLHSYTNSSNFLILISGLLTQKSPNSINNSLKV
jgi:hypothetical protein